VADSQSGWSVANAGDVNRDGKTDLIIGAYYGAGRAYIVFGKGNGMWPSKINLGSLGSTGGVTINGGAVNDHLGRSVSGNVDVNGDNTADIIVSADQADPDAARNNTGITYVVFGSATLPATIDANDSTFFDGTKGFKLFGEMASDYSGESVSSAGDVNGDGIGDIIIGAHGWDLDTIINVGRSYVVFGHRGAWPAVMELSSLDGKNGFTISGSNISEYSGYSVSGAGDINNDGLSDIIVGAPGWTNNAGRAVVVYGSCSAGQFISSGQCDNCTLGNGCHACDMTNGDCTSCPDDRWIDGTGCKTCDASCVSCNVTTKNCKTCPTGKVPIGTGCVDGVVVSLEIEGTTTADDLKQELERELGIQVTVIEVGEGVFEVTVTDDTIATDLVNMINNVCRSH
jgi:hypothetical protein